MRGGILNRVEMTIKLERRFQKIAKYISSKDKRNKSYARLFGTKLGKNLGTNIDRIQEFSLKGILTIFPFEPFINALRNLYEDERYITLVKETGPEDSHKIVTLVKNEVIPQVDASEVEQLFNKTDERVFMGTLATSIYSLLDAYTKDALSLIITIDGASSRILRNLSSPLNFSLREVERILENPDHFYEELVLEEAKMKGIVTRLKLIKSGTGLWNCIYSAIESTSLGMYEQHFKDFIDFRHIIAHENPVPNTFHFLQNELIRSHIKRIEDEFKKSMDDTEAPPEVLSKLFDITMNWLNERQIPIGIIMQLTSMASVYPAIIDNSIVLAMNL